MYRSEPGDGNSVVASVIQHGEISGLIWVMQSDYVGTAVLLWIGVIFIILVLIITEGMKEEEPEPEPSKKTGNRVKKAKKGKRKKRR